MPKAINQKSQLTVEDIVSVLMSDELNELIKNKTVVFSRQGRNTVSLILDEDNSGTILTNPISRDIKPRLWIGGEHQ